MRKNFEIKSPYLFYGNTWFDLHNDYYLADNATNDKGTILALVWNKLSEEWVNPSSAMSIYLLFDQIEFLEYSNDFPGKPWGTSIFVNDIGYLPPDEKYDGWLVEEHIFSKPFHLVFTFMNDEYIRVACNSIIFAHIENTPLSFKKKL
jgi:hypothetical protein